MAFIAILLYLFRINMNILFITTSIFKCFMNIKLKIVQITELFIQLAISLTVNKLVSLYLQDGNIAQGTKTKMGD